MADRSEIVDLLTSLSLHYLRAVRPPEEQARMMADYAEDLKGFPLEAIEQGCKAWRHSSAIRFPTPGQLIEKITPFVRRLGQAAPVAWKPCDRETYERMTVFEKLRELTIRRHAILRAAGAMWGGGKPKTREQMPDEWHEAQRRSQVLGAEIKELRELKATYREQA